MNLLLLLLSLGTASISAQEMQEPFAAIHTRAISILDEEHEQIGSGVILDRALVLTNRHVLIHHKHEALFIKNADGIEFEVPNDEHYLAPMDDLEFTSDFGFIRFLDPLHLAPQTPVEVPPIIEEEPLTLAGWVYDQFVTAESNRFLTKLYPNIYHCVHSQPGLSGSPVFNSSGGLVALNAASANMPGLCEADARPAAELQIRYVFQTAKKQIPRILPFLDQRFLLPSNQSHL